MDVISQIDDLPSHQILFSSASHGWRHLDLAGQDHNYIIVLVNLVDKSSRAAVHHPDGDVIDRAWLDANPEAGAELYIVCTEIMAEKNPQMLAAANQKMKEKLNGRIVKSQRVLARAPVIHSLRELDEHKNKPLSVEEQTNAIRQFDLIAQSAIDKNASDIHYEITEKQASVRFRVDGLLQKHMDLPVRDAWAIVRSAYNTLVEAGSTRDDLNERKFQNAVIDRKYSVGQVRLRFGSMPISPKGLEVVLRILLTGVEQKHQTYLELGYHKSHSDEIERAFGRASGVTIIAGTTGSGKSTTLKNALEGLIKERPHHKFRTLEDPVEYRIAGASQTSIIRDDKDSDNAKPFTDALKACLRTDPDFIMIGEVRDKTSAVMSLQAAQTGHQVATTLHTESWSGILNRLVVIGLDYPTIAQPGLLSGLIYQKLMPVICPECKVPLSEVQEDETNHGIISRLRSAIDPKGLEHVAFKGSGCPHCHGKGTVGRTICAETALMNNKILRHVSNGDVFGAIAEWQSHRSLKDMKGRWAAEHAVYKMQQGIVSPADVEHNFKFIDEIVEEGVA
jgi:type II secretory ATPase GspE/PulE/Tfp pilus assembly ATPase PilB-like protein